MATVYYRGKPAVENVRPKVGDVYWWFQTPRRLLQLTIIDSKYDEGGGVTIHWLHYLGLINTDNPIYEGEVVWDKNEWDAVCLKEFIAPITDADLGVHDERCRICHGYYFETMTDLEITVCLWCDGGKQKKSPPSPPPPKARSPLHPAI